MPSWGEVLTELETCRRIDKLDFIRRKYLNELFKKRQRNIICYYSGWLQKPGLGGTNITDEDKNSFMTTVHKLERDKGLDLILHTPGGGIAATESLIDYLRKMFGTNIEVFIPQIAMSAGTMMACAGRKIFMGKESNIGPIDPQLEGVPAYGVLEEFAKAITEAEKNPNSIPIWRAIIEKYHPTFIGECDNAIKWSKEIVAEWLTTGMFEKDFDRIGKADKIVQKLTCRDDLKTHERHIHAEQAKAIGLKIEDIESDAELQDKVLTVHHCYMHTLDQSGAIKIVENHIGNAWIKFAVKQ